MADAQVMVRYMVDDVAASAAWYAKAFGFEPVGPSSPAFAAVERGPLRLLLSGPMSSAGRAMPDGRQPAPGGWTRFQIIVDSIEAEVARLTALGVSFRNEIVRGPGGSQILAEDPSGNLIEVFQPAVLQPQP